MVHVPLAPWRIESIAEPGKSNGLRRLVPLWLFGSVALVLVTWLCFQLGANFATTGFAYLVVIVALSLMDSFISSAIFSAIAVFSLEYFFSEPRFTFYVGTLRIWQVCPLSSLHRFSLPGS